MSYNPPKYFSCNKLSYRSLLGKKAWANLHPDIQTRFGENANRTVTYKGVMSHVYSSFAGKLLAQFCRLIGSPLARNSGVNVPTFVNVYPNDKLVGMTWDRFYLFKNKPINRVKSTKCLRKDVGLVEMVGGGFGMELKVFEQNGAIYFESHRFFWQLGKLNITIPDFLSPGKAVVSQRALDNEYFEFRLEVNHPWLGRVFKQVGIFQPV